MTFKIITKEFCAQSKILKDWLADKDVDWEEIDYLAPILDETVMKDDDFTAGFCEVTGCINDTPIIIKDDKEYAYHEIWVEGMQKIDDEKAKAFFGL